MPCSAIDPASASMCASSERAHVLGHADLFERDLAPGVVDTWSSWTWGPPRWRADPRRPHARQGVPSSGGGSARRGGRRPLGLKPRTREATRRAGLDGPRRAPCYAWRTGLSRLWSALRRRASRSSTSPSRRSSSATATATATRRSSPRSALRSARPRRRQTVSDEGGRTPPSSASPASEPSQQPRMFWPIRPSFV
jgi:hypothetical protein